MFPEELIHKIGAYFVYLIYVETSLFPLLRFATIVGFGFTLGIIGAAEVVWVLWVLVQAAKGLM